MKTIKIIELLNKIANGEEVPKKIRYNDTIYYYDETDDNELARYRSEGAFDKWLFDNCYLNDEIEIIEKPKNIKKLDENNTNVLTNIIENRKKINEIIDYLDYLKSKGDE